MRAIRFTIENGEKLAIAVDVDLAAGDRFEDRAAYVVGESSLQTLRVHEDAAGLVEIEFADVIRGTKRAGRSRTICAQERVPFYRDVYDKPGRLANGVTKALEQTFPPPAGKGKSGLQTFVVVVPEKLFEKLEEKGRGRGDRPNDVLSAASRQYEEQARTLLGYMDPVSPDDEALARARFLGGSAACELARRMAVLSARRPANTLITGETGTGKGVIAKLIHQLSGRPGKFVVCNCAAVSPELFELLFCGNEKNFPNPKTPPTLGYMREADKGTLFLDEIGDLIPAHQAKLLRLIDEKKVKPLGSDKELSVDVRIIAATDQVLSDDPGARTPRFRQQLYERLKQLTVHTPPLRAHLQDIPELATAFWASAPGAEGKPLSPNILRMLQLHSWPRNVRELESFLTHLASYFSPAAMEKITQQYLVRGSVQSLGSAQAPKHQHVDLSAMIDVLAKASHETWLEAERVLECKYGPQRIDDGTIRTSPHFMPFDDLGDEQKSKSRNEASAILQALLDHGFVIRKLDLGG